MASLAMIIKSVNWHFATHETILISTDGVKINVKEPEIGFCFYPTLTKQIQPLNHFKAASKVGNLSSTIIMTAHCFVAVAQVYVIGHYVIGREHDLI